MSVGMCGAQAGNVTADCGSEGVTSLEPKEAAVSRASAMRTKKRQATAAAHGGQSCEKFPVHRTCGIRSNRHEECGPLRSGESAVVRRQHCGGL